MLETSQSLYDILGVAQTAPTDIIRAAYRSHAKKLHPDAAGGDGKRFAEITEAYTVLSDDAKRAKYDAELAAKRQSAAEPAGPSFEDEWGEASSWDSGSTPPSARKDQQRPRPTPEDFATQDPRKLAGIDVWASMPITPDALSWRPEALASQQHYRPATPPAASTPEPASHDGVTGPKAPIGSRVLWTCVWATAAIAYFITTSGAVTGIFAFGAIIGAALFGLPRALGAHGIFPRLWACLYYLFAVAAAAVTLLMTTSEYSDRAGWGIAVAVVTVPLMLGYGLAIRAWGSAPLLSPRPRSTAAPQNAPGLVTPHDTDAYHQWGEPGRGLNIPGGTPFTEENREKGFLGEVLTSQLIDELLTIPALRAVHGLHLPGHGEADIDHLILCGDLVIAVDSKNWSGGDYYWLSGQVMSTSASGALNRRGNPMSWGLGTLAAQFPGKTLVPIIVVHSNDGSPVHTNNQGRGNNPLLMTPTEFVEQVGRWCVDQHATSVDRVALTTALRLMA